MAVLCQYASSRSLSLLVLRIIFHSIAGCTAFVRVQRKFAIFQYPDVYRRHRTYYIFLELIYGGFVSVISCLSSTHKQRNKCSVSLQRFMISKSVSGARVNNFLSLERRPLVNSTQQLDAINLPVLILRLLAMPPLLLASVRC